MDIDELVDEICLSLGKLPENQCAATNGDFGDVVRCTRDAAHVELDCSPSGGFHQHMSVGRPIIRWRL